MSAGSVIRIFICIMGVVILLWTVTSLAKRKLTETFSLMWGLLSVIFIVTGIIIRPVMIKSYISNAGLALIIMAVFCVVAGLFFISVKISELSRRNHELAIDVSLFHEECEELRKELDKCSTDKDSKSEAV